MAGRQGWRVKGLAAVVLAATVLTGMVRVTEAQGERLPAAPEPENEATFASQPADPPPSPEPRPPRTESQPPSPQPRTRPTRIDAPAVSAVAAMPRYRRSRFHLASVPNMYGDTLPPGGQLLVTKGLNIALADLPLAGGARRIKVAENNKALPMDRVFVNYNHFENARDVFYDFLGPPVEANLSGPIDRVTIGIEKTFLDEMWSLDVRMPFVSRFGFGISPPLPAFSISGGEVGNLHATVKRLLYVDDQCAIAGGLGVDIPTGSDVRGAMGIYDFEVNNDAVHLAPFIGFVRARDDIWFSHGFLEVDVPLNGNDVLVDGTVGTLNEQAVLNLDLAAGCWLYRDSGATVLTGVATVVEFHYTTTLNDADLVAIKPIGFDFDFSNFANRMDVVNATVGLHTEIARHTTLRVAGVFPLSDGSDRLFNAEVLVQLNRYF